MFEKGWISCAIDAEGAFIIQKLPNKITKRGYSYNVYLSMANTDLSFMNTWQRFLQEDKKFKKRIMKGNRKPLYYLKTYPTKLRLLLPQVVDLLTVKQERARIVLEVLDITAKFRGSRRPTDQEYEQLEQLRQLMRQKNRKGKPR